MCKNQAAISHPGYLLYFNIESFKGCVPIRAMNLLTPEIRTQIQEISRRAGHIWRYL
jgi:hypothetical protein